MRIWASVAMTSFVACRAPAQVPEAQFRKLQIQVGDAPSDVTTADLNGDGNLDLVVASGEDLTVFLGDGAGAFRKGRSTHAGRGPTGLVAGDFDGDSRIDVLMANHEASYVTLLFGDGAGGLTARATSRVQVAVDPHPHAVAVGDLNEDGHLDFLVDDRGAHALDLFLGGGDGTFQSSASVDVGGDPYRGMFLGDLNDDGHLDLATPNPREVAIFMGDGTGAFQAVPGSPHPAASPFSIAAADVNGDGARDLAASPGEGSDELTVLLGQGDGRFRPGPRSPLRVPGGAGAIGAGDLDGDGFDDLVITAYVADSVTLVYGSEDGFGIAGIHVAGNPWGVAVGDLDGDGRADFATANQGSDHVSVFLSRR